MRARCGTSAVCAPRRALESRALSRERDPRALTRCRWRLGGPFDYLIHAKSRPKGQVPPCSLSGHARLPQRSRQPAHGRLPSSCPTAARAPKQANTCSRVCNESVPHGHTVVVSERWQLGHQGFERLSPRLRRRVHAAPVWALRRVTAPCRQHGAGTPCAQTPRSARPPAHGERAGRHRRCG